MQIVQNYCDDIINGHIPSCKYVRLAVERFINDLNRDDIFFDERAASLACNAISKLKHYKGSFAGKFIKLEAWQRFIVSNIFGWKKASTKKRRFMYADVFVPRKNGKTTLAAGIGIYATLLDGEAGAECYAAAVDREQAKICFDTAGELIKDSPFAEFVKIFRGAIVVEKSASFFKPLTKDTKNKDGLNPHIAICDERHAWKTNEIYDLLKTGMGARSQPLIFSISTAGTDTSAPYFNDLQVLKDILDGIKVKDNHFAMLYMPDEEDNWEDETTWRKVNPNYGVSLNATYMQEEYKEAKMKGGSTLAAFQTKNLNMWVDAPEVWIPDEAIVECNAPFDQTKLLGKRCYVGVDLASKNDISAVALLFPDFQPMVCKFLYYIPEAKVIEAEDKVDYRKWRDEGWMTVVPGRVLDEDWFVSHFIKELQKYQVKNIAYDPWGMWNILSKLTIYNDQLDEYKQNIANMSVPTKELEAMVLTGRINFLDDPVIRWMFKNVVIYRDANANIKLDKGKSTNKIDGVVAAVNALGGYLTKAKKDNDKMIYTGHNLRTIKM